MGKWKEKLKKYGKYAGVGLSEEEKKERYQQQQTMREREMEKQQWRTEMEQSKAKQRQYREAHKPKPSGRVGGTDFFTMSKADIGPKREKSSMGEGGLSIFGGESYFKKIKKRRKKKK